MVELGLILYNCMKLKEKRGDLETYFLRITLPQKHKYVDEVLKKHKGIRREKTMNKDDALIYLS